MHLSHVTAAEEIRDAVATMRLSPEDSRQPAVNVTSVNERTKALGVSGGEKCTARGIYCLQQLVTITKSNMLQLQQALENHTERVSVFFFFLSSSFANNYFSSLLRTSTLMYNFNLHLYDYESDRPSIGRSSREIHPVIKLSPVPG